MRHHLFYPQPDYGVQGWLALSGMRTGRRLLAAVTLGWVPLLALASVHAHSGALSSFLADAAVHARMLVAVPLFLVADGLCEPRLEAIARRLDCDALVRAVDRPRFERLFDSTNELRRSPSAHLTILLVSYILVALLIGYVPAHATPAWHRASGTSVLNLSAAGWWNVLVSLPLLFLLFLGWIWRVLLWGRFLFHVSRMNLLLVPGHPDRAAGLMFLSESLRAFTILAFAIGAIVAGTVANRIASGTYTLLEQRGLILAAPVVTIVLFTWPLLPFMGLLLRERRRGVLQYGALGYVLARTFERKWLEHRDVGEHALEVQDFSAVNDLLTVVDRVYKMRPFPVEPQALAVLVVATLLPFVPIVVASVPAEVILKELSGLLL